jgi:hypothetical protein
MITTFGLKKNEYFMQLVNDTVEMEALFEF